MDSLASTGAFTVNELNVELARFKGYRGVVQARAWAPFVNPGSQSQFESIGRRCWLSAGLPRPRCQCPVEAPQSATGLFHVDYGLEDERFGGEYNGEEFHGEERRLEDEARLAWLRGPQRWFIIVATKVNVVGPGRDLESVYQHEWKTFRARRRSIAVL